VSKFLLKYAIENVSKIRTAMIKYVPNPRIASIRIARIARINRVRTGPKPKTVRTKRIKKMFVVLK
jgi:hypothetical protein